MTMPELASMDALPFRAVAPRPYPQRLVGARHDLRRPATRSRFVRAGTAACSRPAQRRGAARRSVRGGLWHRGDDDARVVRGQWGQPALPDRPRRIRHRTRSAGLAGGARSRVPRWGFSKGGMGNRASPKARGTSSTASGWVLSTARRQGRHRWTCLPGPIHRHRQGDGMILTGYRHPSAIHWRRYHHHAPDRQRRRQPDRQASVDVAPAPDGAAGEPTTAPCRRGLFERIIQHMRRRWTYATKRPRPGDVTPRSDGAFFCAPGATLPRLHHRARPRPTARRPRHRQEQPRAISVAPVHVTAIHRTGIPRADHAGDGARGPTSSCRARVAHLQILRGPPARVEATPRAGTTPTLRDRRTPAQPQPPAQAEACDLPSQSYHLACGSPAVDGATDLPVGACAAWLPGTARDAHAQMGSGADSARPRQTPAPRQSLRLRRLRGPCT